MCADATFLGTTSRGGDFNLGTIFRMTPIGNVTLVHSFAGAAKGPLPSARSFSWATISMASLRPAVIATAARSSS
jgi:uncharacterized repeat protein (TIGR03803 family)